MVAGALPYSTLLSEKLPASGVLRTIVYGGGEAGVTFLFSSVREWLCYRSAIIFGFAMHPLCLLASLPSSTLVKQALFFSVMALL